MGADRNTVAINARSWVDDSDANQYAISNPRINKIIESEMQETASRLDYGPSWDNGAVTYVSGTKDYEIPNSNNTKEYQRILYIKRQSDGNEITKVTQDEMERLRSGNSTAPGDPYVYTAWETPDTSGNLEIKIRVYPTPGPDESGEKQDHLLALIPAALTSGTAVLPFSAPVLRALEKNIAALMYRMMSQDERERRKISGDVVARWENSYEAAIGFERIRINRQKRLNHTQLRVGG